MSLGDGYVVFDTAVFCHEECLVTYAVPIIRIYHIVHIHCSHRSHPRAMQASATTVAYPAVGMKLSSHAVLPRIKIRESYTPCDMWESAPGEYVFDFCQNMAGFTTLRIPDGIATTAGVSIAQQHAEAIHGPKPSKIYHHYGNAAEINTYITKGTNGWQWVSPGVLQLMIGFVHGISDRCSQARNMSFVSMFRSHCLHH